MLFTKSLALTALASSVKGYWLMGIEDFITTERIDPVVTPGKVASHVHSVLGGSNFRMSVNTASLRQSACTSIPIPQDKSAYWFPHLYFHWGNGSVTSAEGGAVIYYLFSDKPGTTTAFPDDFRMISGNSALRTYDPTSFAQQAVTFLCLNFAGTSTRHNELPARTCPNGIRAQINFPSCWDGKNVDSADHKSHVSFPSGGPDSGTCSDPKFPVTLPRIFLEVYWDTVAFDSARSKAMNSSQPFVFANGDPTGYGYHADFINGWERGVLQNAVDKCHCNPYGDPTCCVEQGLFSMNHAKTCRITNAIDEQTIGTLPKLPGNNPIVGQGLATPQPDTVTPALLGPIYAYEGDKPTATGKVVTAASTSKPTASVASVPPVATAPATTTSTTATTSTTTSASSSPPPPPPPATKPVANTSTGLNFLLAPVVVTTPVIAIPTPRVTGKPAKGLGPGANSDVVAPAYRPLLNPRVASEAGQEEDVKEEGATQGALRAAAASESQKERLVKVRRGMHHHQHHQRQGFKLRTSHGSGH